MSDKDISKDIYKLQISKLLDLLAQSQPQSVGLKKLLINALETINHRIRNGYAHRKYVQRIVGHYVSSKTLRNALDEKGFLPEQVIQSINASDQTNYYKKRLLPIRPKLVAMDLVYFMYRVSFFVARRIYGLLIRVARK